MTNVTLSAILIFLLPIVVLGKPLPNKKVKTQYSEEAILEEGEEVSLTETEDDEEDAEDMETASVETTTTTVTKKVQKPKVVVQPVPKKVAPVVAQQGNNVKVNPQPVSYGGDVYNFYFQKAPGPQTVIQGQGQAASAAPAPVVQVVEEEAEEDVEDEDDDYEDAEVEVRARKEARRAAKEAKREVRRAERLAKKEARLKERDSRPYRRTWALTGGVTAIKHRQAPQYDLGAGAYSYYSTETEFSARTLGIQVLLGRYWDIGVDFISSGDKAQHMDSAFAKDTYQIMLGFRPIQIDMRGELALELGIHGGYLKGRFAQAAETAFSPIEEDKHILVYGPKLTFRLSDRWALNFAGTYSSEYKVGNTYVGLQLFI